MASQYQRSVPLEVRRAEGERVRAKHPDKIPVSMTPNNMLHLMLVTNKYINWLKTLTHLNCKVVRIYCLLFLAHEHTLSVSDDWLLLGLFNQIIVEKATRSRAPELDKKKYLVPSDLTGETHEHIQKTSKAQFYSLNTSNNHTS